MVFSEPHVKHKQWNDSRGREIHVSHAEIRNASLLFRGKVWKQAEAHGTTLNMYVLMCLALEIINIASLTAQALLS